MDRWLELPAFALRAAVRQGSHSQSHCDAVVAVNFGRFRSLLSTWLSVKRSLVSWFPKRPYATRPDQDSEIEAAGRYRRVATEALRANITTLCFTATT